MATILYGIRNCDTVKKARSWLEAHDIAYEFHDYKAAGIDQGRLQRWSREAGWQQLLNRAGTTFRKLTKVDREDLDEPKAIALMQAQPSLIKRPVLESNGHLLVGFKPEIYSKALQSRR